MKRSGFSILLLLAALVASAFSSPEAQEGRVFWRGTVDDRVRLTISGSKLVTETVSGREFPDGVFSFTAALPEQPVVVAINKREGRGTATVTQQPTDENDFTAVVEIHDPRGGEHEYQLDIHWR